MRGDTVCKAHKQNNVPCQTIASSANKFNAKRILPLVHNFQNKWFILLFLINKQPICNNNIFDSSDKIALQQFVKP